jgi:hypothetical protein
MRGTRRLLALAVLLGAPLAACERGQTGDTIPFELRITGDSVIPMTRGETGSVECAVRFTATVDGPQGEHVVLRGGRIDYKWWISDTPASSYEMGRQEVLQLWYDSIVQVYQTRHSHPQTFAQGSPSQPVRGEAWFEYATSTTGNVQRTEPFRFYCYEPD